MPTMWVMMGHIDQVTVNCVGPHIDYLYGVQHIEKKKMFTSHFKGNELEINLSKPLIYTEQMYTNLVFVWHKT